MAIKFSLRPLAHLGRRAFAPTASTLPGLPAEPTRGFQTATVI